jgi:hypothetical protein
MSAKRDGGFTSARQRTVVLTFATVEDARRWDADPSVWRLIDAIEAEAAEPLS